MKTLLFLVPILLLTLTSYAVQTTVFGPLKIESKSPNTITKTFAGFADNQPGTMLLTIDDLEKKSKIEISLNNSVVFQSANRAKEHTTFSLAVRVNKANSLKLVFTGKKQIELNIEIKSEKGSTPPPLNPTADFSFSPSTGIAPELISFSGLTSFSPNGPITDYSWNFGDGTTGNGSLVFHNYTIVGNFNIALTVTDSVGAKNTKTLPIVIKANQLPLANFTYQLDTALGNLSLSVDATSSTDADGTIVSYLWDWGDQSSANTTVASHTYLSAGSYNVKLTVTDNKGGSSSKVQNILIQDTTPPVLSIQSPLNNSTINAQSFSLSGSANENLRSVTASFDGQNSNLTLGPDAKSFSGNFSAITSGAKVLSLTATDLAGNVTTISLNLTLNFNLAPVARIQLKSAAQGVSPLMVIFDASGSTSADGSALSYAWNFGDGSPLLSGAQLTHEFQAAGNYTVTLTVTSATGASSSQSVQIAVTDPVLPPAPESLAPPLAVNLPTKFTDQFAFLTTGANPIQKNVTPGALAESRISVLRGLIQDGAGTALSGVKVTVQDHPEFGETMTRADGYYDLAANGGGVITLNFSRNGYLPAQRKIETRANDFNVLSTVSLVRLDPKVNLVSFGGASQLISGSAQTDTRGTRTSVLYIPSGTAAQIVMPDGSSLSAPRLSLRATEYTVGANGQQRMPADLPARSAYTFAVDISADEALAVGANRIKFSQPVSFYLDNFLNIPVGYAVPSAAYDYVSASWVADYDGLVISLLGVDPQGLAQVDINGSGTAASSSALAGLGFNNDELLKLASNYSVGKSLWRVRVDHFSPRDLNFLNYFFKQLFGFGISYDGDGGHRNGCADAEAAGCIIDINRRIVREKIDLLGSGLSLNYSTERQAGRNTESTITVPITDTAKAQDLIGAGAKKVSVTYDILGRHIEQFYEIVPNLTAAYTWDGKDVYGRDIFGTVEAKVTVSIYYVPYYGGNAYGPNNKSFAGPPPQLGGNSLSSTVGFAFISKSIKVPLRNTQLSGVNSLVKNEMGSWTLNMHHHFDSRGQKIYFGDGTAMSMNQVPEILSTLARGFNSPQALVKYSDGSLLIAEAQQITKKDPQGVLSVFAPLVAIKYLAVGPDDSVYATDSVSHSVKKISPTGVISTVAGTGISGFSGDGGDAALAQLNSPSGLAVTKTNDLFIADTGNHIIRRVRPDGAIETFAGTPGVAGMVFGFALQTQFNAPKGLSLDCTDALFVMDSGNLSVDKIDPYSGLVSAVTTYASYIPAALQASTSFDGVMASCNGQIYAVDRGNGFIYRPKLYPPLTVIGNYDPAVVLSNADGLNAQKIQLKSPAAILENDSTFLIAEAGSNSIRRFGPANFEMTPTGVSVPSSDGTEIFQFDPNGRHLKTLFAKTGTAKWSFSYDQNNYLSSVTDFSGNVINLIRDGSGNLTQVQAPFGRTYNITLNSQSYLQGLTLPTGETYQVFYTPDGMMTEFRPPRGNSTLYTYEAGGYLKSETDPLNNTQTATFSAFMNSINFQISRASNLISPMGRTTKIYDVFADTTLATTTLVENPDGTQSRFTSSPGSQFINVYRNGATSESFEKKADPRLGGITTFLTNSQSSNGYTGNTISMTKSVSGSSSFNFNETINLSENGYLSSINFSSATKTKTFTSSLGHISTVQIDNFERPTQIQDSNYFPVQLTYNTLGQLIQSTQGTRTTQFSYDSSGFLSQMIDAEGRSSTYTHDASGRLKQQSLPGGSQVLMNYDANSNLTELIPSSSAVHSFVMSLVDLVSVYQPPKIGSLATPTSYSFNADKQMTSVGRADGKNLNFNYDPVTGQLTSTGDGQNDFVNLTYETGGRVDTMTSSDGIKISYSYTSPQAKTYSGAFAYNLVTVWKDINRVLGTANYASGAYAGGSSFVYNSDGLATSLQNMQITREPASGAITATQLGGVAESYQVNNYAEVQNYSAKFNSTALYSVTYTRDNLGRITNKSEIVLGAAKIYDYSYDLAGRLSDVKLGGATQGHYEYDSNSNRTVANTKSATYDEQDGIKTFGDNQYVFNVNGELERKINSVSGEITSYVFDIFGQLKKITKSTGVTVEYLTDPEHKRAVRKLGGVITGYFVHDNSGRLVAELNADQTVKWIFHYMPGAHVPEYMASADQSLWMKLIKDQLGSVRLVVNASSGAVAQQLDYDEFGNVLMDTSPGYQPFGFAGGQYDSDSKLVLFGARSYDAETGRWISKDPIGFSGGDTNFYRYCGNDPLNCTDPMGLWGVTIGIGIGGYLGAGADAAGGVYFGSQDGHVFGGFYGSGATGFGGGAGVGLQGTYYPDANSINGSSVNYNANWWLFSGSRVNDPNTGNSTGYGFGIGLGSPRGGSVTFGNTGTIGIIGKGDGSPVDFTTNACHK